MAGVAALEDSPATAVAAVVLEERGALPELEDVLAEVEAAGVPADGVRAALDGDDIVEIYRSVAKTVTLTLGRRQPRKGSALSAGLISRLVGVLPRRDSELLAVAVCDDALSSGRLGVEVDRGWELGGVLLSGADVRVVRDAVVDAHRAVVRGVPVAAAFDAARAEVSDESCDGELHVGPLSQALAAVEGLQAELSDGVAQVAFVCVRSFKASSAAVSVRWAPEAWALPQGARFCLPAVVPRAALDPLHARSAGAPQPGDTAAVYATAAQLWDPSTRGELTSPSGALCAARALLVGP